MNDKKITTYSTVLTSEQLEKLRLLLAEQMYSFSSQQYMLWKAVKNNINISAYINKKIVIQGKGTHDFVLFVLEPEILKKATLGYSDILEEEKPFTPHIGIDESGKGDFFGPLVIGAAFVNAKSVNPLLKIGVKDSKSIKSDKKITNISNEIKKIVEDKFSVVVIGNEAYNRLYPNFKNLNRMLAWGHARALENLLEKGVESTMAISDQFANKSLIERALMKEGRKIELIQKTKAESDIAVAAASILARAEFVKRMNMLSEEFKINIPKGASSQVKQIAMEIIKRFGTEKLYTISKAHFKTYSEVVSQPY